MRIVVALGGNALGNTPKEQLELVKNTVKPIVDLIEEGNEVIISHGNGPQVGMINLAMEDIMPFPECGAMSQGYIGFHLQNALREELSKRKIAKEVGTIVTQVVVDEKDPSFLEPTKPIGSFYKKEEADIIKQMKGYVMKEDAGRGYRRVVPSPKPVDIVEKEIIQTLVDNGHIVIAVGGGGIPVVSKMESLIGVSAVIDKDFASSKLAELLDADFLIILTAVEKVSINYMKNDEVKLDTLNVSDAYKYIGQDQFAKGSMLPKIEAAVAFAESKAGRKALITSLERAAEGIKGQTGTLILK